MRLRILHADPERKIKHDPNVLDFMLIIFVTLVGAFFRLWSINSVPPGLSSDEADWGYITLRIVKGELLQISELGTLSSYFSALPVLIMGRSAVALRIGVALSGIMTIPFIYLWVYESFNRRLIAFIASGLYAITFACVHLNRLAFPPNPLPFVQALAWYMFWRGIHRKELWSTVCAGMVLGLSLYCYQASFALIFAMMIFWASWLWSRRSKMDFKLSAFFWAGFALTSLLFLVKFLPNFFTSPRYTNQFIFNPKVHQGKLFPLIIKQISEHAALFGFTGDGRWRHNLPGKPIFDPVMSLFFWAGIVIAIAQIRKAPYSFILLNLGVTLLPGILAKNDVGPHFLHISGAFIPACLFPAITIDYALEILKNRIRPVAFIAWGFFFLFMGLEGYKTFYDYFRVWAIEVSKTMSFDEIFVETAHLLSRYSPQPEIWLLPNSSFQATPFAPSSFTFNYASNTPFKFIPANESEAPKKLKEAIKGRKLVGLVEWDFDALKWAALIHGDKKGLLRFLLEQVGTLKERRTFNGITVSIYEMPQVLDFTLYPAKSVAIHFDKKIALRGFNLKEEVNSGEIMWVVFLWEAINPPGQDYKAAVYITDEAGHIIAQDDRFLMDKTWNFTSSWQANNQGLDYRLIPIPPGTTPGRYQINVAVYEAESLQKLPVTVGPRASARLARIGEFTLMPARQFSLPQPGVIKNVCLNAPLSLCWFGFELPPKELIPGDKFTLTFYWQALQDSPAGGNVKIELVNSAGNIIQSASFPIGLNYPPELWRAGEVVTDRYDLILGRTTPAGDYTLGVKIELRGEEINATLGAIQVKSWPRNFVMPTLANKANVYFSNLFRLVGYEFSTAKLGENLKITLCWQALREMSTSYVTFVHLLAPEGTLLSQVDTIPGYGKNPTTAWLPGEYICSSYELPVPTDGSYLISLGAYDPATEERLPLQDEAGNPLGDSFKIIP